MMKNWAHRIAIAAFCAGVSLSLGAGGARASQLDDIVAKKKIVIAVSQDSAPFASMGPDLKPEGYDVDLANLLAKDMGVAVELVPVTGANRIPYLQTGKADLIIATLGANPERAKTIWFSAAYAPFYSAAYAAKGTDVKSPADLKGKKVGATRGNLEELEISRTAPQGTDIKRYEDNATSIAAFLAGQVDVLISNNTAAKAIMTDNPKQDMELKFRIKESPCFIGVRKGEIDLLQWVNVFLLHKKLSGELDAISKKWLGEPTGPLPTF